jgi:hypothetical protein
MDTWKQIGIAFTTLSWMQYNGATVMQLSTFICCLDIMKNHLLKSPTFSLLQSSIHRGLAMKSLVRASQSKSGVARVRTMGILTISSCNLLLTFGSDHSDFVHTIFYLMMLYGFACHIMIWRVRLLLNWVHENLQLLPVVYFAHKLIGRVAGKRCWFEATAWITLSTLFITLFCEYPHREAHVTCTLLTP